MNEIKSQNIASIFHIAPRIYDYYMCKCDNAYGVIIMEYLKHYITDTDMYIYLLEVKHTFGKLYFAKVSVLLRQNIENALDILVDNCNLSIPDCQLMVNPINCDVKLIDFGLAECIVGDKESYKNQLKAAFHYLYLDTFII